MDALAGLAPAATFAGSIYPPAGAFFGAASLAAHGLVAALGAAGALAVGIDASQVDVWGRAHPLLEVLPIDGDATTPPLYAVPAAPPPGA